MNLRLTSKGRNSYIQNVREPLIRTMVHRSLSTGNYIVQIARFDPAKGIPTVLNAYASFRTRASKAGISAQDIPQLVM